MRRLFILALGILMATIAFSQSVQTWTEDFDGAVSFTATPANSWVVNTNYHQPYSSTTNPKSYLGLVPDKIGNSTILETPIYDCTNYDYVLLRFSHICKVSPSDIDRIEYRTLAFPLLQTLNKRL
jgi:hypothetical protein